MSQENVEIVRALYAAFDGRDNLSPFDFYDPEIVWDCSAFPVPGMTEVFYGHEGVRTFWARWLEAWETLEFELGPLIPAGDDVIVIVARQTNLGRGSGVKIEQDPYAQVWTLREGKVVRMTYSSPAEALEAAGLSE